MTAFRQRLDAATPSGGDRRWIYVAYDQLSDAIGPLAEHPPAESGIVLVESASKGGRRPYHRQKLALILANQRQFALEQAERGVAVDYRFTGDGYRDAVGAAIEAHGTLVAMEPAERELRRELAELVDDGALEWVEHEGWLTTTEQFETSAGEPPWRMDRFYRRVRQETGVLMEGDGPAGGKYSHDADNRQPWPGEPPAPKAPRFEPDDITREVADLVNERFSRHPGTIDLATLPATAADAAELWQWALDACLEHFGPYEDAMSTDSRALFHTRISPLLNLHRLLPKKVVEDAAASDAPLQSREGFVRQVLGWREFMRHVHRATDGLRLLPSGEAPVADAPGDGGWGRAQEDDWPAPEEGGFGGARPSLLGADRPLPAAWWGDRSGLECLDRVVAEVWATAYTHHIPRLMVLANLATLLDVDPRELTDWFWVAFADAYDWVVEPNVLGMGSFAAGDLFTTKPYVSGANYIARMSDYCTACRFDPKGDCPVTPLYWAFLDRHRTEFADNRRMSLMLGNLKRRDDERRQQDREMFKHVSNVLSRGEMLEASDD